MNFLFKTHSQTGSFFAGAGPSFAVAISGKTKTTLNGNTQSTNLEFGNGDGDDMKRMDLGANFITGYQFKSGLLFSLNYNAGLTNLIPGDAGDDKAKSNYFGFKIGYLFGHR